MDWYIYIAQCADGSLYTGITTDLSRRFQRHNQGRGSAYIRSRGWATPVYAERCANRTLAMRRERAIKSWPRTKKLELIQRRHVG